MQNNPNYRFTDLKQGVNAWQSKQFLIIVTKKTSSHKQVFIESRNVFLFND
jgi:hypothetical protein